MNPEHLAVLCEGQEAWNQWRREHPSTEVDLSGVNFNDPQKLPKVDFTDVDLSNANLTGITYREGGFMRTNLRRANLRWSNLVDTWFIGSNLTQAILVEVKLNMANFGEVKAQRANFALANLRGAQFVGAKLQYSVFSGADLALADFTDANLQHSNLSETTIVQTNFSNANLNGCSVYGCSVWDPVLTNTKQSGLVITPGDQPAITVDNVKLAQFVYLLLNNPEVRDAIDTITCKVVLILGRFTKERKAILDMLKEKLRTRNLLPVIFDFEGPRSRDLTETISTLAHMARFIIADITDAKSIPQELMAIVPHLPSVPVQPIQLVSQREYGMFEHFKRFPWVYEVRYYSDLSGAADTVDEIIARAVAETKSLPTLPKQG
ncbi:MAG TPA: pentapeptide repeat-containing protein [Terriglobales bacterium]|jgi:uncharacterized protein YjbI with pentapeptide repeats|nr:pentapeptide repeat-containing protein [Terriglobales bacterium]